MNYKELKEDKDYLIYEDGRLFSLKNNRFLSGKIDNVGYQTYSLAILNPATGKKGKMFYAHRLVAEYFIPNPNNLPVVHHKDGNKLNNSVGNLSWVDYKENYREYLITKEKQYRTPKYFKKDLEGELWIPLKENILYEISNKGRIRNIKTNRLLKIDATQKYYRISLNDKKHYYLHRLVYCNFNNDYDLNGCVIDHIDCNPANNNLENLQKITFKENNLRRFQK